jgi:hypothetical protein
MSESNNPLNEMEFRKAMKDLNETRELRQMGLHAQAGILWDYFNALKAQGFTDMQALYLVGRWHPLNTGGAV